MLGTLAAEPQNQAFTDGGSEEERKSFSKDSNCLGLGPVPAGPFLLGSRGYSLHRGCRRAPEAWWEGQLAESIHKTLQERERMLDTIKLASPQLNKRQVNKVLKLYRELCGIDSR